jgi:hypothetical protein
MKLVRSNSPPLHEVALCHLCITIRGETLTMQKANSVPRVSFFGRYGAAFELGTATCLFAERYNSEDGCVQQGDPPPEKPELGEDEAAYQTLWQTYFRNIAVRERRNPPLQRQCMPTRHWKYLVEVPGGGQREGR